MEIHALRENVTLVLQILQESNAGRKRLTSRLRKWSGS